MLFSFKIFQNCKFLNTASKFFTTCLCLNSSHRIFDILCILHSSHAEITSCSPYAQYPLKLVNFYLCSSAPSISSSTAPTNPPLHPTNSWPPCSSKLIGISSGKAYSSTRIRVVSCSLLNPQGLHSASMIQIQGPFAK